LLRSSVAEGYAVSEYDEIEAFRELAAEIEGAFESLSYPGDDDLIGAPTHWEAPEVLEAFRGKHWKDVPLSVLFTHRLSLPLFSDEAFRFYLPAYLVAALLHPEEVDTLRENVFFSLTPPESEGPRASSFMERMKRFDAQQTAAIRRFVELYVQQETSYPDSNRERALMFWQRRIGREDGEEGS
jgi:hypothetical protein